MLNLGLKLALLPTVFFMKIIAKANALVIAMFTGIGLFAAPGDTTRVRAHDKVDMTWYQGYKAWGVFPAAGKSFHKVDLNFTIGCASTGCSDWDYTVTMYLLQPTGLMDSTVSSVDSITLDTTWRIFERKERLEMARMITPYGSYMRTGSNGFNSQWKHTLVYDLTDFQVLLRDSVEFEVFYSGWSSGFSATLDFEMIEGIPAREVTAIRKVWNSEGGSYANPDNFNNNTYAAKEITLNRGTNHAWLRMTATGHGFVNDQNCAEFCKRDYYVAVNNKRISTVSMWRDDCGLNPIYPQGGTWLYDRANWCPGGKGYWNDHYLTPHYSGSTLTVDFDIQHYTLTVPPGETPPTYIIGNLLFEASRISHTNDAEMMDIIAPNNFSDHKRFNPRCGQAIVKIRNKGSEPLTSCIIKYRMNGSDWKSFIWRGNLEFYAEEQVTLPLDELILWQNAGDNSKFEARVELPNGVADEYALNDTRASIFNALPEYPRDIYLQLRTNNVGSDTWWKIYRYDDGKVVSEGDNLNSNTIYHDTMRLTPGCYELVVGDRRKNGLGWWANSDGNGFVRLRGHSGTAFTKTFPVDFGTELRDYFLVKMGTGIQEQSLAQSILLYPNPAKGFVTLEAQIAAPADWKLNLRAVDGSLLLTKEFAVVSDINETINLQGMASGIYLLEIETQTEREIRKIIIP